MLRIGTLLILLCLPTFSAQSAQYPPRLTFLPCSDINRPLPGKSLSLAEPARLLLAEPESEQSRPKVPPEERVRVEAGEELVSFLFPTPTVFTPWVGAGLVEGDEAEFPSAYRFGAGFGCDLGPLTRLNLGYRFSSHLGLDSSDSTAANDEERHLFSLGLRKSF